MKRFIFAIAATAVTACGLISDSADAGAVGGPRSYQGFLGAGQTRTFNVDLFGGFTTINVYSTSGADMDVRVVGALTGLEYAHDNSPSANASANFSHLPTAKMVVLVTNSSPFAGGFVVQTN